MVKFLLSQKIDMLRENDGAFYLLLSKYEIKINI